MKTKNLLRPLSFLLFFCGFLSTKSLFSQTIKRDTITDLSNPRFKNAVYKAPNGKFYKVEFSDDPFDNVQSEDILVAANCLDSAFAGTARKGAKTSEVVAKVEDFASVSALLKTLVKDAVVRAKLKSNSPRIAEEKHYVRLTKDTYLFAFKKESDNDYHVIIGDNKDSKKATLFNVEISGLAASKNKNFTAVRTAFEKQFVQVCSSSYVIFAQNPIKISIEGSTFFDVDHKPGQIGPIGFQPATNWEIHPISKIKFL
jgi:hypothetical protein